MKSYIIRIKHFQHFTADEEQKLRQAQGEIDQVFALRIGPQQQKSSQKRKIEPQRRTPLTTVKTYQCFYVLSFSEFQSKHDDAGHAALQRAAKETARGQVDVRNAGGDNC